MVRTNQGGSILSFLVIGGVMVLLLVGGAYAIRHLIVSSGDDSERIARQGDNETKTPTDPAKEPSKDTEPAKEEDKQASGSDGSGDLAEQPRTPQPEKDPRVANNPSPGDLPNTGPEDLVVQGVLISSLVAFAAAYLRSRQAGASL